MSENQTTANRVTSNAEKVATAVGARLETAMGEMNDLRGKGFEQVNAAIERVTRAMREQLAFAEQMGGEWHKLMLGATRTATGLFTPKS